MAVRWSTRVSVNWRRSTLFNWWKQTTQRRHPASSEVVARQSLQSIDTNNHCTWCHSKVVACSVPTALWLVVTSFTLAICKCTCMFTLYLLCLYLYCCVSVIQFKWFEFNLPSLCKVATPRSRYCRSSLLTLQGVVLLLWLVLWLVRICGYCALIK